MASPHTSTSRDSQASPDQPQGHPTEAQHPGLLHRLLLAAMVLLLGPVALLAGMIGGFLTVSPHRVSVLLLGTDQRPDQARPQGWDPGRTDSMVLLIADRTRPAVGLISIPRDLWVPIPGHGEERINTAYRAGELERRGSGPDLAGRTVAETLGTPVDRYVVVDMRGLAYIVDVLGGIDVDVEHEIVDDQYPTDDYKVRYLHIAAGRQHMDGETALAYARTRHGTSDFARMARQQQVLLAIRDALLRQLSIPRLPGLVAALATSVRTNIGPLEAFTVLASLVLTSGTVDRLVIDDRLAQPVIGAGGAFLLAPTPGLRPAVAAFIDGVPPDLPVEVLNGAGVPGLARRTADILIARGFHVTTVGDAERPQERTTVLAPASRRRPALLVAQTLGLPASAVSNTWAGPGIRVVLGQDAASH